jgi:hypothetical protein
MGGERDAKASFGVFGSLKLKKSFINLVLRGTDGTAYMVDTCPARRAARLKIAGERLAFACGKSLSEEIPS